MPEVRQTTPILFGGLTVGSFQKLWIVFSVFFCLEAATFSSVLSYVPYVLYVLCTPYMYIESQLHVGAFPDSVSLSQSIGLSHSWQVCSPCSPLQRFQVEPFVSTPEPWVL